MKGILSYGAYIPYNRLQRKKLKEFFGTGGLGGEKAVASYDEDSVTMGVEAAFDCLRDLDEKTINSVYFVTTSGPYKEKSSIPTMVKTLDLPENVQGVEAGYSLRGGTSALLAADGQKNTLIISADCRVGTPKGTNEQLFGDGAAAFIVGSGDNVIARIVDGESLQEDIIAQWQSQSNSYIQTWEDRFVATVFLDVVKRSVETFFAKNSLSPSSIAKVVISGPGTKAHIQAGKKLGFKDEQIQDPLLDRVGAAGTAHALMMLVAALEEAKPGDCILLINFAEGTDIILFEVTDAITQLPRRKGIKGHLNIANSELTYSNYLTWKGILEVEQQRRPEPDRPSATALYRNYHQNLGFWGSKCRKCGAVQFPKQEVCVECRERVEMEDYRLLGRKAVVANYTVDYLAASPSPPTLIAAIDFEGGGRILTEFADCSKDDLAIGIEVEMTFRKLGEVKGIHNYFWKARPKR